MVAATGCCCSVVAVGAAWCFRYCPLTSGVFPAYKKGDLIRPDRGILAPLSCPIPDLANRGPARGCAKSSLPRTDFADAHAGPVPDTGEVASPLNSPLGRGGFEQGDASQSFPPLVDSRSVPVARWKA